MKLLHSRLDCGVVSMALSSNLVYEFAKVVAETPIEESSTTLGGTAIVNGSAIYVRLDGSTADTPVKTLISVKNGERVTVQIKNHVATVIGSASDPASSTSEFNNLSSQVVQLGTLVADKVSTDQLNASNARITTLEADNVMIKKNLSADTASITTLTADNVTIKDTLTAQQADVNYIKAHSVTTDVIEAKYATIDGVKMTNGDIYNLTAHFAALDDMTAAKASITDLQANKANVTDLDATNINVSEKLSATDANLKYATITNLNATNANVDSLSARAATFESTTTETLSANTASINDLQANKADITSLKTQYADIDFTNINYAAVSKIFSDSGVIKDLIVDNQKITGELVGVKIKGDLIEAGTLIADKLVVSGENGLYYKLNWDGTHLDGEQTEYNSLNGQVITASSITADKVAVHDLNAFGATIGNFHIGSDSLYSESKASIDNTNRGIYLGADSQVYFGDQNSYLKYYKDGDNYKLKLSADEIEFGASSKRTIQDTITNMFSTTTVSAVGLKVQTSNAGDVYSLIDGRGLHVLTKDSNGNDYIIAEFKDNQSLIDSVKIVSAADLGAHRIDAFSYTDDDVNDSDVAVTIAGTGFFWIGDITL